MHDHWGRRAFYAVVGTSFSLETIALATCYFGQGTSKLARLGINYFVKDALQAPPSTLDVLKSLHSIPWTLKPLYGVLSDTVPIFGYRRRSYLVLSAALGAAVWASLALLQPSLGITMACVVLEAVSGAFSDVVVDSLVVARARASPAPEAGALQSMCWASKSVGVILSSYTSGWLIQRGGPRLVFLVTAVVPLIVGAAALTIPERATPSRQGFQRLSGGEDPAPSLRPPKTPSPGFDRGTRLLPSPCRTSCDGSDRRRTDPRLQTAGGIAKHGNVSSGEALSAPGAPPVTEGDACSVAENDGLESVADGTGVASEGSTQGWGVRVEKKSKDTAEAPLNAVGAGRRVVGGGEGEWRGGRGEDEGGEAAGEGKTKGMGAKAEREAWEREAGGGRGMMEEKEAGETDALLAVADGNAESTHVAVRDSAPSFGSAVCGPAAGPPASRIRTGPQPEPGSGNASRDEAVPDGRAILGGEPLDAGVGGVTRRLVHALLDRRILVPLVFLFLWAASPSPSSAMFYFYTGFLGFSPAFMGRASMAAAVATLCGILIYNRFLRGTRLQPIFFAVTLIGTALHASQIILVERWNSAMGIPDYAFMLGDRTLLAALHELGHMPLLVMAARMCPPGVEATMFATLMSVSNLAQFVSEVSSAALTSAMAVTAADMSRLWLLVAVCSATQLVPLPLIPLIPSQLDRPTPALCTRPLSGVELARRGQNDAGEVGEGRVSSELQAAAGA